jgi:hypothetical protein
MVYFKKIDPELGFWVEWVIGNQLSQMGAIQCYGM